MKEQWIIEMQQKLAGYRQPAPEVSWDVIEEALTKNRHRVKAKKVQMWTCRIAAAVLVLVVATMGYRALNKQEATIPQLTEAEPVITGSEINGERQESNLSPLTFHHSPLSIPQGETSSVPQEEASPTPQTEEPQEVKESQEVKEPPVQATLKSANRHLLETA